jgi:hypothetical protein
MPAKGSTKANHKYVSRRWKNGHWEYYYKPSKVSQYQSEIDSLKNEIAERDREAKLTGASARGYASKAKRTNSDKKSLTELAVGSVGTGVGSTRGKNNKTAQKTVYSAKAAVKKAQSDSNLRKKEAAQKKLDAAYGKLYTEARKEARAVMADPRYQKQLARNAAKIRKDKEKKKKKREASLKRLAFKYKTKHAINRTIMKGQRTVNKLLNAIKRKKK